MARPIRIEYPGAVYHVIVRGNAQQNIFLSDQDKVGFLGWLRDAIKVHNFFCHAYCLMDNHFHLLLETPDGNLSKAMRDLNGHYTQWFNARHKRSGHLLQGRYKAYVIEREMYLLEVARYIVLNPVRAGLVRLPNAWKWSSYRETAGLVKPSDWLYIDWILGRFGKKKKQALDAYREFVIDGIEGKDPHDELAHALLLGSPQFVHEIWCKTVGSEDIKDYPREQRMIGRPTLEEIFSDIQDRKERDDAIVFARIRCGYLASEIARYIGLDRAVVGRISRGTYNRKKKVRSPT